MKAPDEEYGYDDTECIPALVSNFASVGTDCIQYVRFLAWPERKIIFHVEKDGYGESWRCWPRRPTDAEREAAMIIIHDAQTAAGWSNGMHEMDIHKALLKVPTVDAVPVVHGRWKIERCIARCTNCGIGYRLSNGGPNAMKFMFCPNCGAKMDGEKLSENADSMEGGTQELKTLRCACLMPRVNRR